MARLLVGAQSGFGWPDFAALGVTSHPSFGTGAVYRGRFSPISVVVLADPAGPDDVFTGRALTGEAGQRLQSFLEAAGLTSRYLVLRTVPVDTSDVTAARRDALVDRAEVRAIHAEILRRVAGLSSNSGLAAVVTVGRGAARLAPHVVPAGLETVGMKAWSESGARTSWQAALDRLAGLTYPKDVANPSFQLPAARGHVPANDLPYGTPHWYGSSGDRASRPVDRTTGRRSAGLSEALPADLGRRPRLAPALPRRPSHRRPTPLARRRRSAAERSTRYPNVGCVMVAYRRRLRTNIRSNQAAAERNRPRSSRMTASGRRSSRTYSMRQTS